MVQVRFQFPLAAYDSAEQCRSTAICFRLRGARMVMADPYYVRTKEFGRTWDNVLLVLTSVQTLFPSRRAIHGISRQSSRQLKYTTVFVSLE